MSERDVEKLNKQFIDENYEKAGITIDESEEESRYNNLLDKDGFEINPGIIQDCSIWLTGGSVRNDYYDWENDKEIDAKSLKREYVTFHARLTLFGNDKPTIISYDVPESSWDNSGEQAMRWGVVELIKNFRLRLDEEVNKLIDENGQSNTIERL